MSGETLRGITMVKKTVLIVAVVAVVAVVCAATVFIVLSKDNNKDNNNEVGEEQKYWFFIDFRETDKQNMWISSPDGDNPLKGFLKALEINSSKFSHAPDIENDGWINSIDGVEPDFPGTGESWYTWTWNEEDKTWNEMWTLLGDSTATIFYMSVTSFDSDWSAVLKPGEQTGWQNKGPFAT